MVKKILISMAAAALATGSVFAEDGEAVEFAGEVTTGFMTDGETNTIDVEGILGIVVTPVEGVTLDVGLLADADTPAAPETIIDEFKLTGEFGTLYDLPFILTLEAGYFEAESSGYNVLSGYEAEELLAGSGDETLGDAGWAMAVNVGYEVGFGLLGVYGGAAIDTIGDDGTPEPASWMGGVYTEFSIIPLSFEVFYDNAASDGDGMVIADASYAFAFGESTLDLGLIESYDMAGETNLVGFGVYFNTPVTEDFAVYAGATDLLSSGDSGMENSLYLELSAEYNETVGLALGSVLAMGEDVDDSFLGMDLGAYVYGGPMIFTVGYLIDSVEDNETPAALNAPGNDVTGEGGFYMTVGLEF